MTKQTKALPDNIKMHVVNAGLRWLMGPNDFDECIYDIAAKISAGREQIQKKDEAEHPSAPKHFFDRSVSFHSALSGVAAGIEIGKYIERHRKRRD